MNETSGEGRRQQILDLIKANNSPINGSTISKQMGVSRQVIVQDIALLRASQHDIISTNRGYIINTKPETFENDMYTRVFKVSHSDEQIREELEIIISLSGVIVDVYVDHEVYGKLSAELGLSTKLDIDNFIFKMQTEGTIPLKNITNNYHYHTVKASSEKLLNLIEQELKENGFLCE